LIVEGWRGEHALELGALGDQRLNVRELGLELLETFLQILTDAFQYFGHLREATRRSGGIRTAGTAA